jgi:hypothetical protein
MTDWVQTQTGPNAPMLNLGRWEVRLVPHGWVYVPDFGIRKAEEGVVPSNVAVNQDTLLCGDKLSLYIDAQIALMKNTFKEPMIAGPRPAEFAGADEAMLLMVKHGALNGYTVVQVQNYVRCGSWIGIVTLTTLEPELLRMRQDYERFFKALVILPEPEQAEEQPGEMIR